MKSYLESQITWNLYQDSESRTLFYFVMDPSGRTRTEKMRSQKYVHQG